MVLLLIARGKTVGISGETARPIRSEAVGATGSAREDLCNQGRTNVVRPVSANAIKDWSPGLTATRGS